jgi:2-polyprenyl-3-methyl-5-hydroxy-6-metoxy-1,4-benzoquinol methylase
MFTNDEIRIANATSRTNGASAKNKDGSVRAVVPKYVAQYINKEEKLLDFGAGRDAVHTKWLRELGFDATAYDFGDNVIEGLHDKDALSKKYSVIMASNVLNVQSSMSMLWETLRQISSSLEYGGKLICNYPSSPRKMELLTARSLEHILKSFFNGTIERVGGSASAPLWVVRKEYLN